MHDDGTSDTESDNNSNEAVKMELPITKHKDEIVKAVESNQFVIIHGHTGSGKTTQVPQFLYQRYPDRLIGITQPRRIAAVSMAQRVAKEMECSLGAEVGYEIRFEKKIGSGTKIKYMTDGILLNECMATNLLKDYSVIMVDEAHERSVISDVLIGILKKICQKRDNLRLIVASATISIDKFKEYLPDAKVVQIEGKMFYVEIIYDNFHADIVKRSAQVAEEISKKEAEGDILIFLPGQDDINQCCNLLDSIEKLYPLPLYSAVDFDSQKAVFEPAPVGKRKVVVATNIAETSITIDKIRFVVDCGYVKQNNFLPKRGLELLETVKVSKAQATQRTGRAGRTSTGWCYRLYTRNRYDTFDDETTPEIFRKNLSEICLRLYVIKADPETFDFIDKPSPEEIARSKKELLELNLMDDSGVTELGEKVSHLPLEPVLAVVIIKSLENNCLPDVVKILSMLTEDHIFKLPRKKVKEAREKRKQFESPNGDHFMLLKVFNEFYKLPDRTTRKRWCYDNFIDYKLMDKVLKVNKQLKEILVKMNSYSDVNTGGIIGIRKTFVEGYYQNLCIKYSRDSYIRLYDKESLLIHPSSCLRQIEPNIILFYNAVKTTKTFMHSVMRIEEEFLRENFQKQLELIKFPKDIKKYSILF